MNYDDWKRAAQQALEVRAYPKMALPPMIMSLEQYEWCKRLLAPAWRPGMPMRGPVSLEDLTCPYCRSSMLMDAQPDGGLICHRCIRGWANLRDYALECAELDEGSGAPSVGARAIAVALRLFWSKPAASEIAMKRVRAFFGRRVDVVRQE